MQQGKVQSVVGYLDPKKLLTKSNRSGNQPQFSPSHYLNQCPSNLTSPPRQDKQPYRKIKNDGSQQKMYQTQNQFMDKRQALNQLLHKGQLDMKSIQGDEGQDIYMEDNTKIDMTDQAFEEGERCQRYNKTSGKDNQQRQSITYRSDVVGLKRKGLDSATPYDIKNRKLSTPNKKNSQISQLVIKDYVNKLTTIKNTLEQEINKLKILLDDVQANQQQMDSEFLKFKEKILEYVSRALDSSFREYKSNLPKWQEYQNIQKEGEHKLIQINDSIQICQDQQKLKLLGGRDVIQKNIQQFIITTNNIKQAYSQGSLKMPFVSEDKIKKFQNLVLDIGKF